GGGHQDVHEVGGRPLPGDDQLDDVVEQAGDAADEHQPAGTAVEYEKDDDGDQAQEDLPDAGRGVDRLEHVRHRAPVDRLHESRDGDVEAPGQGARGHEIRVQR